MSDDPRKVYGDIIDLPHHQAADRKHMSLYDRAAQFAPFAALSGYDEMVKEEARFTGSEIELSDIEIEALNRKLLIIQDSLDKGEAPEITVVYFRPDKYKSGGAYCKITAFVKNIEETEHCLVLYGSDDIENKKIDTILIDMNRIIAIESELTDYSF